MTAEADASYDLYRRWTEYTPDAHFQARAALSRLARDHGLSADMASDVVLAASELMANAAEHARGPFELRVRVKDLRLLCEVVDRETQMPEILRFQQGEVAHRPGDDAETPLSALEERGRGLLIVHTVSRGRWGVRFHESTKAVWFALSLL
ncbi:ATP-binding protein [Streptomyces radicis]|uniref:ATP-binding protein n=1 Tax=Streptomyces radicis TaxID=1750517 RepID=A0A3A9WUT7_9ACTN|nr:ATP-binding protein [Streptomyces radicis]RKN11566.1 ATP-binding protein [Streptomyces radicis]RKN26416.1 ATP-binding protein [Streptomyces radicis]